MRAVSIRARLTLWYATALGVILLLVGFAAYALIARTTRTDVDAYLADTADAVGASLQIALGRLPPGADSLALRRAANVTLENHRYRDIGVAIFHGAPIALLATDSASAATRQFGGAGGWQQAIESVQRAQRSMTADISTVPTNRERIMALPVSTRRGPFVVAVEQTVEVHEQTLRRVREAMLVGLPLALLLAMAGGFTLAGASLRPVDAMRQQAEQISEHNLHERLPVSRPADELARLSTTFNALLDRVEEAFDQRRRFTADASHELRTPVAVIIGESELALAEERPAAAYRHALRVIHGEARRLSHIVGDLFLLARADASEQPLTPLPLFIEEVVGDCVDAMATIARAKGVTLHFSPMSEVPYDADEALLKRAVMNLLDNAVKYTPAGGSVHAQAEPTVGGGVRIRVRDTGPGVPPEDRVRIFERFFRVGSDGRRPGLGDGSGAGLGLPIARWIIRSHGGDLQLTASGAEGSTFEIVLPPRS